MPMVNNYVEKEGEENIMLKYLLCNTMMGKKFCDYKKNKVTFNAAY